MELKVTTLEGKEAGSVQLSDEIFGLEPRKDIIQRCVQWQLNKRQAGTHKTQGRAESGAPARRCTSRRAPAVPVTARPACRSSAAVAVPSVRWFARMPPICRRRSARWRSSTRCRPRPRTAA